MELIYSNVEMGHCKLRIILVGRRQLVVVRGGARAKMARLAITPPPERNPPGITPSMSNNV
eukprot:1303243-Ditylum_brightwellii.AAC.1